MFQNIYRKRRVLVTGHTGFKGSWLCYWLQTLGAETAGFALPMEGVNHFDFLKLKMRSRMGDVRDRETLKNFVTEFQPEIVFHLAAQPLVRRSYREPAETFDANVMGTVNLLEACRAAESVRAVVCITSDKCYENREDGRSYCETDPMGGFDPYSASKGCAELVIASYRNSFFTENKLLASARAGNVIGGGDWALDRLVPDLVKAAAAGETAVIRNPRSTRPWQHVLEPLSGYLALGQKLLAGDRTFAAGWNFGPDAREVLTVEACALELSAAWPRIRVTSQPQPDAPHEAKRLRLDCTKAQEQLHWHGVWSAREALRRTAAWYRDFYVDGRINTEKDLEYYLEEAGKQGLSWMK